MSEKRIRRSASAVSVYLLLAEIVAERVREREGGPGWRLPQSVVVALTLSLVAFTAFAGGLAAGLLL